MRWWEGTLRLGLGLLELLAAVTMWEGQLMARAWQSPVGVGLQADLLLLLPFSSCHHEYSAMGMAEAGLEQGATQSLNLVQSRVCASWPGPAP